MPQPEARRPDGSSVKSARRVVELIEMLGQHPGWVTQSELHELTGIPRSSLHGLLRTLTDAGWIEGNVNGSGFRLGVRTLTAGTHYLTHDLAVPYATQALEDLRSEHGFTTHYARRFGADVVYLETRESRDSVRLVSRVGRTLPAHATALGKALLAELPPNEVEALLPATLEARTPYTITSRAALLDECEIVRDRGYATEVQESNEGVRCVAAAIPYRLPATDAISCSMPFTDANDAAADAAAAAVSVLGEELVRVTTELGRTLRTRDIR